MSDNSLPTFEKIEAMTKAINERKPTCKVTQENSHIAFIDTINNVSVIAIITWLGAWDVPAGTQLIVGELFTFH